MSTRALGTAGILCAALALGLDARQSTPETGDVPTFAGNAQHTGVYEPAAADLNAIRWSTTIDLRQTFGNTHYGAPLVTARLLNRGGTAMTDVPVQVSDAGAAEMDLVLASLAAGDYLLELNVKAGANTAQDLIAFRVK